MQALNNKRRILYIALSIFFSIAIWIFVDASGNPDGSARTVTKELTDIPVEFVGETTLADRGLMLLEEGTDESVTIKLAGTRWNIAMLDKSEVKIQVDLSDITTTGSKSVVGRLVYADRRNANLLSITDSGMLLLTVNVDELYSKTVDVYCEIRGNVAGGYSAGEVQMSSNSVEIRGQKNIIDAVSYAKVILQLNNAEATVSEQLDYQFYDEQDNILSSDGIHAVDEQIQVTLPVNVTKELRLVMNFVESDGARIANLNYELRPATITVTGDAEQLKYVDSIVLDEFDLKTLGSSTAQYHHIYSVVVPDGCTNLSGVTKATLDIGYRDMTTATLTSSQFVYDHIPDGKTVETLTNALSVTIFGTQEAVQAVTPEDITIRVDLSNYSDASGSYTLPAQIEIETAGDIGISGTYQVRLTIEANEESPGAE